VIFFVNLVIFAEKRVAALAPSGATVRTQVVGTLQCCPGSGFLESDPEEL